MIKLIAIASVLLFMPVAGWCETIYRLDNKEDASMAFMVKSTGRPNKFLWYVGTKRCEATLNRRVVSVKCPENPLMILTSDQDDVVLRIDGDIAGTYVEGSVVYGMYSAITNYSNKQ